MSKSGDLARLIRDRAGDQAPDYGLILGSGLGHLSSTVEGTAIPYDDLPGFPHTGVSGHVPQLVIGTLEGRRVAVFGGRAHYYESGRADIMRLPLEVLRELGCGKLLLTNAAGSTNPAFRQATSVRKLPPTERRALDILEAKDTWTRTEIRKQYKSLVKDLHPDMNGGDRSDEDRLQEVVWAWDQIKESRSFRD